MGEYVLTGEDVLSGRKFDDGIALSSYPIDVHNPAGTGTRASGTLPSGEYYSIPYRCLVPKEMDGLLVAGRPISATHEAHASARIQVVCFATGQAAGVAAALALQRNIQPRDACRGSAGGPETTDRHNRQKKQPRLQDARLINCFE